MKHIEIIIGGRYEVVDEQGTRHSVEVLRDNDNGTLMVRVDGAEEPQPMAKVQLEELLSNSPSDGAYAVHTGNIDTDELNKGKGNSSKKDIKPSSIHKNGSSHLEKLRCLFWILVIGAIMTGIYFGCKRDHERKLELKREYEHQKDCIAYAEDSIKREYERIDAKINSKEYKDSVAAVRKLRQDSIDRNTMVMIFKSDSLCHYSTICSEVKDIKSYQFTSQYNAKQQGKKICPECEEREDYYWGVKDGEYIYFEDINVQDD